MTQQKLQSKKQSLLGLFFCFFLDHKKVDGEFTDDRGYLYFGKCSRCGALYGKGHKPEDVAKADEILKTMTDAGLDYDEQLEVLAMARQKYNQLKTTNKTENICQ